MDPVKSRAPRFFYILNSPLTKAAKRCTNACSPTYKKGKAKQERLRGFNAKKTQSIANDEKSLQIGGGGGVAPPPNPPAFFL